MTRYCALLVLAVALSACASGPTPAPTLGIPDDDAGLGDAAHAAFANQGLTQHTFSEVGGDVDPEIVRREGKTWLVYASNTHSPTTQIYAKLLHEAGGLEQWTYTPECDNRFPRFNPKQPNVLVYTSNRSGKWDLYLMDILQRVPVNLSQRMGLPNDCVSPAWCPDGQRISFSLYNGFTQQWEIHIAEFRLTLSGALDIRSRPLQTPGGTRIEGMLAEWSPTADAEGIYRLAFQRPRRRGEEWYGVWTIRDDGVELREIAGSAFWASAQPAWSPDGKKLVFTAIRKSPKAKAEDRWQDGDDLWAINVDGTGLTQVTAGPEADWDPIWDEDRIYFLSVRDGRQNIWSVEAPGCAPVLEPPPADDPPADPAPSGVDEPAALDPSTRT